MAEEKDVSKKRKTHKERAAEQAEAGVLKCRYVDEEGLALYLSVSVHTLANKRKELPKNWTWETIKTEIAKGIFISPPYAMVGGKIMYDLNDVDRWFKLWPVMGRLPENEEAAA